MNDEIYREIRISLEKPDAFDLTQALDDGDALPQLSGYYEVLYDERTPRSDRTDFVLYFPVREELAAVQVELLLQALGVAPEAYEIKELTIERQDYLEAYKQHYRPFRISRRICIVPSWDRGSERERELLAEAPESISLYLDPGLAFGTGKHPTTELCLRFLDELQPVGWSVIDAGSGSGILALGALLLGARDVYAFDIDGNAETATRQNLAYNATPATGAMRPADTQNLGEALEFDIGGFDLPAFTERAADLCLANITANVLLAGRERFFAARFPRLALSGVLVEQQKEVCAAFDEAFALREVCEQEGWVLIDLERR